MDESWMYKYAGVAIDSAAGLREVGDSENTRPIIDELLTLPLAARSVCVGTHGSPHGAIPATPQTYRR